jgi:hypothetical protein
MICPSIDRSLLLNNQILIFCLFWRNLKIRFCQGAKVRAGGEGKERAVKCQPERQYRTERPRAQAAACRQRGHSLLWCAVMRQIVGRWL